ncbi:hypothetical protein [Rhizobium sp. NFACC06-2]|uniref:hypothetical protein n=1 Tax=Rhizobium sp. NFACC06-2 TaxID=1566264 RepID=UPI0008771069|nr:hypothetical protein [Rhizobium sp. NFACC06-2]SCY05736.1 hypothetical protein SAMN03159288_01188 [Rhizobium sp. NFACC06-2]
MQENRRRIRSIAKANWTEQFRRDPVRLVELAIIGFGTGVAALSSFFAWQAASSTAEQAKYAREALTNADANATFRAYISSWNKLCNAITPPEYFLEVGTPFFDEKGHLFVTATNLGFDRAAFDVGTYIDRVAAAEEVAKDNLLEFRTFIPEGTFARTEQAQLVTSFFYFSPEYLKDEPDGVKKQIVMAAALCHYYTEEQLRWFKDRSHKIPPVINSLAGMNIEYSSNLPPAPRPR